MNFLPRRRRVPHSEYPGGTVFLTWRLHPGQPPLTPEERDLVLEVIARGEGVLGEIVAAVVMDDHVHALLALRADATGQRAAQTWKSVSSHRLTRECGRRAPVWQREYFDRWLLDRPRIETCASYILQNPVRRWSSIPPYKWVIRSSLAPGSVE